MKKRVLYIIITIVTILSISSCKNDLDVLAPGAESVSVYGILNPSEAVQNIRINKVYLTSGDAVAVGQDFNTINYDTSELKVSLQRFMSGSNTPTLTTVGNFIKKEIVLTGTLVTTSNGIYNTKQWIWQTTDRLYSNGEYKLTVYIKKSDKKITSQTVVVDSVKSYGFKPFVYNATSYPMHGHYDLINYPGQSNALINYSVFSLTQKIKFKSIPNAKLYNVTMRFHYFETLYGQPKDSTYVDYNFPTQKSATLLGGEEMEVDFSANDFYINIAAEISKKSLTNIKNRKANYIEYIIRAAAENMNIFLQVNQPSTTIAQDKPNYTNINGGVGIFSSQSRSTISHDLDNSFINNIACHPNMYPLLFIDSNGNAPSGPCPQ